MNTIIETCRLFLRKMTQADYPKLAEIIQDDQTMYAYEGAINDEETQSWLDKQLLRYREDDFGLLAVILKNSGKMIGQAGLSWQNVDTKRIPEIGYLFNRKYWGNGYATEAAIGVKNYAFEKYAFDEVYSMVRDINISSMNVAIRNGMLIQQKFIKHYRGIDMPHYLFSVKKGKPYGNNA